MKTLFLSNVPGFIVGIILARIFWSRAIAFGQRELNQLELKFGLKRPNPPA